MYELWRQLRHLLFLLGSLLVVVPGLAADTTQEFRLATEGYRYAFRSEPEFLCGIGREAWHDDQQTAQQEK